MAARSLAPAVRGATAHAYASAMWIGGALWATVFALLDWWRWMSFHANGDFSIFVQSIVSGFPAFYNTSENANHFSVHFSPIYALVAPFVVASRSVVPLLIAPAVAGGLVGPGVFLLARRLMPARRAAACGFVALAYPPLAGVVFGDPFETVFAPAATVWLLYAFEARNVPLIAISALAALSIKEDQGLFLIVTGFALAWRHRGEPRLAVSGMAVAGAAAVTFVGYFGWLRPRVAAGGWTPAHFYDWRTASRDTVPWYSFGRLGYLLEAFAPLVFVPLASPMVLLAIPPLFELLASPYGILFTNGTHYAGGWIGYVLAAFVYAIARIERAVVARRLLGAALALCLGQLAFASPTHWRVHLSLPDAHDRALTTILGRLPPAASVTTFEEAYAHLGFDPNAAKGIHPNATFIVIDTKRPASHLVPVLAQYVREHPAYVRIVDEDGIEVFERRNRAALAPQRYRAVPLAQDPTRR